MPQPVSSPITSTPSVEGQPYDASDEGACGGWAKLHGGAASINTGRLLEPGSDNWPGDGHFTQT